MKRLLLIGFLFVHIVAQSQNLQQNIPSNAAMIVELNTPAVIKAVPFGELEKSSYGQEVLGELSKLLEHKIESFDDLGVQTTSSSYMFLDKNNNQLRLVYLFPIKGDELIQKTLNKERLEIEDAGNYKFHISRSGILFSWTNSILSIVLDLYNSSEFEVTRNYLSPISTPIAGNAAYQKEQDPEAAFSFWVEDVSTSVAEIGDLVEVLNRQFSNKMMASYYKGYKSASMKLYLGSSETKLSTEIVFSDDLSNVYRKIAKQKYNSQFFKYVDLENCLGYFSSNVNVESFLTAYPTILGEQLAAMPSSEEYKDELNLGMSLFSTLLDEKAVGEIVKGDMLIVVSEISNKNVEYTTYEYDSSYNRIPITKSKMEKVPEFIVMASTKEGNLTTKTINYLLNKKLIERQDIFYKIASSRSIPFELYLMIKNDVLFIGTSKKQFHSISQDNYNARVPKEIKKHITDNQIALYAGINKVGPSLLESDFRNEKEYAQTTELLSKSPDIIMTAEKFKKNTAKGTVIIKTPAGYTSGLIYLLSVLDELK